MFGCLINFYFFKESYMFIKLFFLKGINLFLFKIKEVGYYFMLGFGNIRK